MLALDDKWIWDFWFAHKKNEHHIFYLQAPKNLLQETKRHHNANIGHAVSTNFIDWEVLPDALFPGSLGEWDDLATWTGSIIKHNSLWYMFYTGVNHKEKGLIQRIGIAISKDLISWEKFKGNPVISADEKYYEMLDLKSWHDQAWRDPFVFKHENYFHAFITARVNFGPADGRGVIAHAISANLFNWKVLPPITEPGDYGQLEVPQLISCNKKYFLLFNTNAEHHSQRRLSEMNINPVTGANYLVAAHKLGPCPYILNKGKFLFGDKTGTLYSGKLIKTPIGKWSLIAFHNYKSNGDFIGEISDPFEVDLP